MSQPAKPVFDFSSPSDGHQYNAQAAAPYVPSDNFAAAPNASNGTAHASANNDDGRDHGGYKGIHPIAAGFHVAFKLGSLLTFILGGIFSSSYVVKFVVTVLFCAADFWTTKNVTGRILVALRWWNEVKDDGTTQWVFESSPDADSRVNGYDSWFFWITTGGYCIAWLVLCVFNLMSISTLPIALVGFLLAGANLLGYIKCKRDASSRITSFMINQATSRPETMQQAASYVVQSNTANAKV